MYYAFFAPAYKGDLELRGLAPGSYKAVDYSTGKDYGSVSANGGSAKLAVDFKDHLLLEVSK